MTVDLFGPSDWESSGYVDGYPMVLDSNLRPVKERLLRGPARLVGRLFNADQLSAIGLILALLAAGSAANNSMFIGLAFWIASRIVDGLDGVVARARSEATDLGGYIDLLVDTVGYAAIPLGIAIGLGTNVIWIATALLLGSFYINSVSWLLLSAIYEKRGFGSTATGVLTTVRMPAALIEGTETIILFALFFLFPANAHVLFVVMACAVLVGVVQRFVQARSTLSGTGLSDQGLILVEE